MSLISVLDETTIKVYTLIEPGHTQSYTPAEDDDLKWTWMNDCLWFEVWHIVENPGV